jgi:hypothetical protein
MKTHGKPEVESLTPVELEAVLIRQLGGSRIIDVLQRLIQHVIHMPSGEQRDEMLQIVRDI